ncbi:MAG: GNAT family N-acetyltransferase [Anaerolineae bacterium]|nr:GNAT family N-acetyltransferase [Anaerolineae bacterium]
MIYGTKVRLRAVERSDLPTFVRWFNDPEVRQYLIMYLPMSLAQEERWFERLLQGTDYIFVIEAHVEGQWLPIGNCGLSEIDWKNRRAVLGIVIGEKAFWGQGFGTDAVRTLLRFAFHELGLHRVSLDVYDFNPRAMRCYEKAGLRREGTKREALFRGGRFHDVHLMAILHHEFDAHEGAEGP